MISASRWNEVNYSLPVFIHHCGLNEKSGSGADWCSGVSIRAICCNYVLLGEITQLERDLKMIIINFGVFIFCLFALRVVLALTRTPSAVKRSILLTGSLCNALFSLEDHPAGFGKWNQIKTATADTVAAKHRAERWQNALRDTAHYYARHHILFFSPFNIMLIQKQWLNCVVDGAQNIRAGSAA